ncbi:DUF4870 domain-containing protein [Flavobacterium sp.]|uniref:DUF4870 domain-containing protein n=1 Tax=Flavobacterium sp. TaxID=239 RepID=UPI002617F1EF|nr:DUF4870 domain-containing protein [Flavobacterium sp.]
MITTADKNASILLQISTFTQYFFPLGNYIFPVLIWSMKRKDSEFIDRNGRAAINFQLSLLVYFVGILLIAIPVLLYNIFNNTSFTINNCNWIAEEFTAGKITTIVIISVVILLLFAALKVIEFCLVIYAAVKNSNGEVYKYPLTINFIK